MTRSTDTLCRLAQKTNKLLTASKYASIGEKVMTKSSPQSVPDEIEEKNHEPAWLQSRKHLRQIGAEKWDPQRKLSPQQIKQVCDLFYGKSQDGVEVGEERKSVSWLAKHFSISGESIRRILHSRKSQYTSVEYKTLSQLPRPSDEKPIEQRNKRFL